MLFQRSSTCFFFLLLSLNVFAQIEWSDSTAQAITYWEMYDSVTYDVKLEKIKVVDGDTISNEIITYDVGVTVVDSTENSYVLNWHYYGFETYGASPFMEKMMGISENIDVNILTDELGTLQRVVNWEEVRDYANTAIDKMLAEYKMSPDFVGVIEGLKQLYATEASVTNGAIQDAQQCHVFYGVVYKLNEEIVGEMQVANVYIPTEPFDAKVSIQLINLDKEKERYTLKYKHVVNPEQLKKATIWYIKELGMPVEVLDVMTTGEITNTLEIQSVIDNYGWVLESKQVKTTTLDTSVEYEIRTIELK